MDPTQERRESTALSGVILLLIVAAIIGIGVYLWMNPDILENIAIAILIVVLVIALIAAGIFVVGMILAVPMYMAKGTTVQTDMSYSIDDVKEVDGSMENRKE